MMAGLGRPAEAKGGVTAGKSCTVHGLVQGTERTQLRPLLEE